MQLISFTVENLGTFKAKENLSILEEAQLEQEIDEFLNNRYYELKKRQTDLAGTEQYTKIKNQLQTVEIVFELNKAIVERPETIPTNIGELSDYEILVKIWNEYQKKKTKRRERLTEVTRLINLPANERFFDKAWLSENKRIRQSILIWWKKHYNLCRGDSRFQNAVYSEVIEDYLEYIILNSDDTTGREMELSEIKKMTEEPGEFTAWANRMKELIQKRNQQEH